MREDLTVFWKNNAHAYELFADLLARAEHSAYDDEFLKQLAAYREETPESERADIFAAQYLLHHGDAEGAAVCGERAYQKRPVNYEVWKVLASAYQHLGRAVEGCTMQGYAFGLYGVPEPSAHLPADAEREGLNRMSVAAGVGGYVPLAQRRAYLENNAVCFHCDVFIGETLPLTMPDGSARFWVGCYTENEFLSDKSYIVAQARTTEWFANFGYRDFVFDLQKAQEVTGEYTVDVPEGREVILPLAGTQPDQELSIQTASLPMQTAYLGKWAFSYFRLNESAVLRAEENTPYAVGTPILLGHHPSRRKLVLNILVDALSWNIARTRFPSCMPHIAEFFTEGTIFDQHFSCAEHTYPSLPAIETGYYPHHLHVFNEKDSHEIPRDMHPVSERMKALGYYCAAPMACGEGIHCGAMRGYDRIIDTPWVLSASKAADRTIRHLEAFDETDQFLFLHVIDVHPWNAKGFKFMDAVETHLPFSQRLFEMAPNIASVRLPKLAIYQEQFWRSLADVDRSIGYLLSYIEGHYAEDEYIINLYSDHGNSVFSPAKDVVDVLSENSTRAVWMMRGAGVPKGIITPELTSVVDIYAALGHLAGFPVHPSIDGNLPAVFGGQARDAVYSASQFPGQTFKLAVRSENHTLRLETREVVDEDGTVDFADATVGIYPRAHELEAGYELGSEDLRAFFYPRARDFVRPIASNGEFWPAMRAARPAWFGEKERQI